MINLAPHTLMVSAIAAILLYLFAFGYQTIMLLRPNRWPTALLQLLLALAVVCHGIAATHWVFTEDGLDFSLFHMLTAIGAVINAIVLTSSLRKPVLSLFILLSPIAALILLTTALIGSTTTPWASVSPAIGSHIMISILAYSLMTIAAFQAVFIGWQNWRLKNKKLTGGLGIVPPLQTMESLLFDILWMGFILLSLSLLTGFLFFEDLFAQHLAHKTVFSLCAWLFYGTLLWGRHIKGWRGNRTIRWTLVGFSAMVIGYLGSKIALEFILS